MANDIIVSEMTSASQINTNDLMIMTQPDLQAETGYSTKKGTVLQVANKMLKGTEYLTDLPDFTDKTVLGGLEELKGDLTALLPVDMASGAIANFDTDLSLPLVDCKANIVASQPSGTPTPSSPLAISGYTGMNLTRCGKNLISIEGRTITSQTTVSSNFIIKKGTYAFSADMSNNTTIEGRLRIVKVSNPNVYVANLAIEGSATSRKTNTFTLTEDTLCYAVANGASAGYNFSFDNVQLELGSTATAYAAYNGTTYPVSWQDEAGTVYGGNIDLTTGVLTKTHIIEDMGNLVWTTSTAGGYTIYACNGISNKAQTTSATCEIFPVVAKPRDQLSDGEMGFWNLSNAMNRFAVRADNIATLSDFQTAVNGKKIVYEVTTPVTYQLTPVQVQTLLGVNNVFNDTNGDTEVKYKEGIQHYIDKKIAATQALIL